MPINLINSYRIQVVGLISATAAGGIAVSGSATASATNVAPAVASANISLSGSATASVAVSAPASATGNVVLTGASSATAQGIILSPSASGGIVMSGSATSSSNTNVLGSAAGGIIFTGTGSATATTSATASGGIVLTGSAASSTQTALSASAAGGVVIGGSATGSVGTSASAVAAGGIVLTGSTESPTVECWPLTFPITFPIPCGSGNITESASASGGMVLTGSATASTSSTASSVAAGGIVLTGSADGAAQMSSTENPVATGNIVIGGSASGVTSMGSSTTNATATGNIIIGGSATATAVTPYSNVYSATLNGSSDYLPIAGSQSSGTFDFLIDDMNYTVAMWFSLDDYTQSDSQVLLANNYTGSFNGIQIWYDNRSGISTNAIRVNSWAGSSVSTQTNNAVTDTNWHHLVVTASGASGTLSVYLDGNTTPIATASLGSVTSSSTQQDLAIGGRIISNSVNSSLDGRIDEVSIWNTAISSADVSSLYNGGSPVDLLDSSSYDTDRTGDLFSWWRMGDGTEAASGSTVYDMSSNSNNATLNGTFTTGVPTASPPVATGNIVVSGSATATLGTGASAAATGNIVIGGSATATATTGSSGFTISTFDTEANILASTPSDGTVAYGTDTESYYVYDSSLGWAEFTPT